MSHSASQSVSVVRSVIGQIRLAAQPGNRLAALFGALVGAVPPVGSFLVVHGPIAQDSRPLYGQPLAYLVAGLLVYSAVKVTGWMTKATGHWVLGVGWTVGVEGLMVGLPVELAWFSGLLVGYLVVINAVSSASRIVADYQAEQADWKAERAVSRAAKRSVTAKRSVKPAAKSKSAGKSKVKAVRRAA